MDRKEKNKVAKAFVLVLQIGITMITSVFLCGALGYYIDYRFGTSLMIFFIAFGVISGYSGVYSLIKQFVDLRSSEDRYAAMFDQWDEPEEDAEEGGASSDTDSGEEAQEDEDDES